jgi:hypothetical protein
LVELKECLVLEKFLTCSPAMAKFVEKNTPVQSGKTVVAWTQGRLLKMKTYLQYFAMIV